MNARRFVTVLAAMSSLCASSVTAQNDPNEQGANAQRRLGRMYDPQTAETITGEVTKVEHVGPSEGMPGRGVHLTVKTSAENVQVDLGPEWFVEKQKVQIKPHDKVSITGSRVTISGEPVVIAREIKKGDEVLRLRDSSGRPAWAGWQGGGNRQGGTAGGHGTGRGMMHGRDGTAHERMHEQQRMFSELKSMRATLDKKLAEMNSATGQEKTEAMAAVINEMVRQHDQMLSHMETMHEHMVTRMDSMPPMRERMEENEPAGAPRSDQDEPQNEDEK